MTKNLNSWVQSSNDVGDEISAANRAIISGERKVWDANFAYQMALSSGNTSSISAAEQALKAALAEDIRRKGGRHEDVLLMHRSFHGIGNSKPKWLLLLALAGALFYFLK